MLSEDLVANFVAYQIGNGGVELLLTARQKAAVDASLCTARNHIVLVAGGEHGGVGGVRHRRCNHPREPAKVGQTLLELVRIKINFECLGNRLEEGSLRVGDLPRPLVGAEPGDRRAQLSDRILVVSEGTMPGLALSNQIEPRHSFLRGLDEVEPEIITK